MSDIPVSEERISDARVRELLANAQYDFGRQQKHVDAGFNGGDNMPALHRFRDMIALCEEVLRLRTAQPLENGLTAADYEEVLASNRLLVRELDVVLNGDNAAKQAALCDIVCQVKDQRWKLVRADVQPKGESIPDVLFDGYAVLNALDAKALRRTSAENVSDVLDAVVRLLRSPTARRPCETEGEIGTFGGADLVDEEPDEPSPAPSPSAVATSSGEGEPNNYHDAYRGARDDLLEWKQRALKAEANADNLARELANAVNGPTFMGDPVLSTPQARGYEAALRSIAKSTCCGTCQEAALIARAALPPPAKASGAFEGVTEAELKTLTSAADYCDESHGWGCATNFNCGSSCRSHDNCDCACGEHASALRNLAARLTRGYAAGWLPIETAPRDGTTVLTWCGGNSRVLVRAWMDGCWQLAPHGGETFIPPTHWQPLPPAPYVSAESEGA